MRTITNKEIENFKEYLIDEEKSDATLEKYIRDITVFSAWLDGREVDKKAVLRYKERISEKYAPATVNSVLSSLNSFFDFCNWHELKVKMLKIQKQIFAREEKELTKAEYERLLTAARSQKKRTVVLHYANNMCLRIKGVRTSPRHN